MKSHIKQNMFSFYSNTVIPSDPKCLQRVFKRRVDATQWQTPYFIRNVLLNKNSKWAVFLYILQRISTFFSQGYKKATRWKFFKSCRIPSIATDFSANELTLKHSLFVCFFLFALCYNNVHAVKKKRRYGTVNINLCSMFHTPHPVALL